MNKVMLIGNIGREPEVRYYEADQAVATVSLATTERAYTLPGGTEVPERTDWHNLVFFKQLARVVERYVHKGDKLYVEGRLRYRAYEDRAGVRRTVSEVYVDNMELLPSRALAQRPESGKPAESPTPEAPAGADSPLLPF